MKSRPEHLLKFRVYCNPRQRKVSPFFWCTLWRTLPEAREQMKRLSSTGSGFEDAAGACFSWRTTKHPENTLRAEMGEIVLCNRHSGSSVIYHECTHAAFAYLERMQKNEEVYSETPEERMCLTVGWMGRQIVLRLVAFDKRKKQ